MIVYLAADLLWSTRVRSTGDQLGIPMRPVRSIEMLEARLADSPVAAMLVDLDAPEVAMQLIQRLRGEQAGERERSILIVAWGPHVAVDLLQAAKRAGANVVMTRGAFAGRLPEILTALAAAPSNPAAAGPAAAGPLTDQLED